MFSLLKSLAMEQIRGGQTETALETLKLASAHATNEAELLSINEAMLHADIMRETMIMHFIVHNKFSTLSNASRGPEFAGIFMHSESHTITRTSTRNR